jgi:hypothetical protein
VNQSTAQINTTSNENQQQVAQQESDYEPDYSDVKDVEEE